MTGIWSPLARRRRTNSAAAGAGHDVIGDHEAEVMAGGTQEDQSAFGRSSNGDAEPGIAKDGFANLQLNGVIVNEKDLAQARTPEAVKRFRGGRGALRAGIL